MKRIIIETLIGIPVVLGLYLLFDYAYCSWIVHSPFSVSAKDFIIPISTWIVVEIVTFVIRSSKKKKSGNENDSKE